jgi:hypothetical protein
MPGLLNRRPLDSELVLECPGFDGLAERQLFYELLSVPAGHGDSLQTRAALRGPAGSSVENGACMPV